MARQHTTSQSLIAIVGAVLVTLALVIVVSKLNEPAARLMTNLIGAAARTALQVWFFLAPAVWQPLQAYAVDHQWLPCPIQMFVSFWPVVHVIAGAA
jgi:hypothetical protein